jgi:hypothetical protein
MEKLPDALPISSRGTAPTTARVAAGMARPSPAPEITIGAIIAG